MYLLFQKSARKNVLNKEVVFKQCFNYRKVKLRGHYLNSYLILEYMHYKESKEKKMIVFLGVV